jgi:hypothetical protein
MTPRLAMSRIERAARADALRDIMRSGASPRDLLLNRVGVSPRDLRAIRISARPISEVRK